ncbi:MAG: PASTA domain-containing protein [Bacteroidales bacterium]|nr:PASTA domain-containing protein [Bacteroidales bacterium]MBN2819188.1 PASTA domain-containing protein [Bacteroidales bacterium]
MKDFLLFLTSKRFWKQVVIAFGVFIFILFVVAVSLRIYTQHGKSYAVNDFTGLPLEEVIPKLEERGFRYQIFDSIYISTQEPGVIIDQHPKSGRAVKKNRTMFFTINASAPEKIQVPNLVGVTLREGKARLESFGLLLGQLSYRYDISKNVILEQKLNGRLLAPGDSIPKGTMVDLVLGKGLGNEREMIPDLIGLTKEEAKEKLGNAMFSLGYAVNDDSVLPESDSVEPRIFRQKPVSDPSVLVPLGSSITIWLTNDTTKLPKKYFENDPNFVWDDLEDYDEDSSNLHIGTNF